LLAYQLLAGRPVGLAMCQWDCGWYLSIIEQGYDPAARFIANCCWQANWAFFPLLPLLVAGLQAVVGGGAATLGVVVSTCCLFAFALLAARLRRHTRQEESPWTWWAFLLCWPFGFYFHALYTEALFAALATAALLALAQGRPWQAAAATAALSATRPTGVLLAAWVALRQVGPIWRGHTMRQRLVALGPALLAPLGLLAYMAFLQWKLGDALAFQHIQAGWGRASANPLRVLLAPFAALSRGQPVAADLFFAGWALLGFVATLWLCRRRRFAEAWLCGMPVLMALGSGQLISMPRFVSTNPAFLLAAADWFMLLRPGLPRVALLVGMALLQLSLVQAWHHGPRFLM
jgi:hypothetical protein